MTMTPDELKHAKSILGLTLSQMAKLLGYEGKHGDRVIQHLLSGERTIRPAQARLIQAYLDGYTPDDWPITPYPPQEGDVVEAVQYKDKRSIEKINKFISSSECVATEIGGKLFIEGINVFILNKGDWLYKEDGALKTASDDLFKIIAEEY